MSDPLSDSATDAEHIDVLIIGAGISGINAAYHLSTQLPDRSFVVLDALESFGGTWLTHTFPGVRSDTELFTLGYEFKPWTGAPYASGAEIHAYLGEVIEENDLGGHFRYQHKITDARWSSEAQCWTVTGSRSDTGEPITMTSRFLWMCHGYFRHSQGHTPTWPGMEDYQGRWIHPQAWPAEPEIDGREVVVIGSGATAATLVPAIADQCGHVTILQRSPTYFFQSPNVDVLADQLRSLDVPDEWIHEIVRRKAIAEMQSLTQVAAVHPELTKAGLINMVSSQLPEDYEVDLHFTPRHLPAQQRVARILDGDLFRAISDGKVTMVTDEIETFTADGILTKGGQRLHADVVVTATGFDLTVFGDIAFSVDGEPVDFSDCVTYRGIMFTGIPNMAWTFGALRLSWTMRAELVSQFICRLFAHMDELGAGSVTPGLRSQDVGMELLPYIDPAEFSPGYLQRSIALMPKSGSSTEWRLSLDYWDEREVLPIANLDDGCLAYIPRVG